MKRRKQDGYAVIEFTHAGIPDDQLRPEEFNEHQIEVMNALEPKFQDQIRRGIPIGVMDVETGEDIESFIHYSPVRNTIKLIGASTISRNPRVL